MGGPLEADIRLPNSVFKPYASIGTNLLFFEKGAPTKDSRETRCEITTDHVAKPAVWRLRSE